MTRFDRLLVIALSYLSRLLHNVLCFYREFVEVHGCIVSKQIYKNYASIKIRKLWLKDSSLWKNMMTKRQRGLFCGDTQLFSKHEII